MTNAVISDTTGKLVKSDLSYQIDIYNRGSKCHLKFDTEFNDQVKMLARLSVQNGVRWFELRKNKDTGKWDKITVPDPIQETLTAT